MLETESDWDRLPTETPESIRSLLRRCLRKERRSRLHDIADARTEIEEAQSGPRHTMPEPVPSRRPRLAWSAAILLGFSLLSFIYFRETPSSVELRRFQISPPDKMVFAFIGTFAVSPDGGRLAYWAEGADNISRLWLRDLNALEPRLLLGTESTAVSANGPPFWSSLPIQHHFIGSAPWTTKADVDSAFLFAHFHDVVEIKAHGLHDGGRNPYCRTVAPLFYRRFHGRLLLDAP